MTDARILLSKVDRTLAYDPFIAKLYQILEEASARGYDFWVTLLFRTYAAQMRLYFQGRTLPGKIVTKARGGESGHCFGLAADLREVWACLGALLWGHAACAVAGV